MELVEQTKKCGVAVAGDVGTRMELGGSFNQ